MEPCSKTKTVPSWEYLERIRDLVGDLATVLGDLPQVKEPPDWSPEESVAEIRDTAYRVLNLAEDAGLGLKVDPIEVELEDFARDVAYERDRAWETRNEDVENILKNELYALGPAVRELHDELVALCAQPYRNPTR